MARDGAEAPQLVAVVRSAMRDEAEGRAAFEGVAMMNQKFRDEVAHLRSLTSEEAFQWIPVFATSKTNRHSPSGLRSDVDIS